MGRAKFILIVVGVGLLWSHLVAHEIPSPEFWASFRTPEGQRSWEEWKKLTFDGQLVAAQPGEAGAAPAGDVQAAGDFGGQGYGEVLSHEQVRELWRRYGGDPSQATTASAVATAESGRRPRAANTTNTNGSADFGLFQINTIHRQRFEDVTGRSWSDVYDPDANTAYAVFLQREQGWRPWVAYTSNAYSRYLV